MDFFLTFSVNQKLHQMIYYTRVLALKQIQLFGVNLHNIALWQHAFKLTQSITKKTTFVNTCIFFYFLVLENFSYIFYIESLLILAFNKKYYKITLLENDNQISKALFVLEIFF